MIDKQDISGGLRNSTHSHRILTDFHKSSVTPLESVFNFIGFWENKKFNDI